MATAKAVAAGNSCRQEDVIATANLSRKAVSDMLTACKVQALALLWFSVVIKWFGLVRRRRGVGMCQTGQLRTSNCVMRCMRRVHAHQPVGGDSVRWLGDWRGWSHPAHLALSLFLSVLRNRQDAFSQAV